MTFIEAIRKSNIIRRPVPKHLGSHGDGWIDASVPEILGEMVILTDLQANDWQAKNSFNCWPWSHKWSRWEDENWEVNNYIGGQCLGKSIKRIQVKYCLKCNQRRERLVKYE